MNTGILIVGVTILLISFEGFIQANHLSGDTNTGRSTRRRNRILSNQIESTNRRSQNRQVDGASSRRGLIEPISQNRRRTQSRFPDVSTRRRSQVETEPNTRGSRRNGRRTRERNIRRRNRINVDSRNDLQNGRRGNGASRTRGRVSTGRRRTTNERRRSGDVSRAQSDMLNDAASRNGQNGIFEPPVSRRGQNSLTDRSRNGGDVLQRNVEQRQRNELQNGRRGNSVSRTRNRVDIETRNRVDIETRNRVDIEPRRTTNERRRPADVSRTQSDILNDVTSMNGQNGIFEPSLSSRGQNDIIDTLPTDRSWNGGDVSQRNVEQRQRNELQNDRRGNGASRNWNTVDTGTRGVFDERRGLSDVSLAQSDMLNDVTSSNGQNGIFEPTVSRRGQSGITDPIVTDSTRNGGDISLQTSNIDGNRVILTSAQDGAVRSMRNLLQKRGSGGRGATPRLIGFLIPRSDGRTQLQLMPGARRFIGNSLNNGSLVDNLVKSKQTDGRNASSPFNLRTIINAARRANLLPGGNTNRRQGAGSPAVVVLRSGNSQNGEQIERIGSNQINQESINILGRDRSTQQQSSIGTVRDPFDIRLDAAGNIINDRGGADQQSGGVGIFDSGIASTLVQNNRFIDTVLGDPGQNQASNVGFDQTVGLNNNELPSSVDVQFGTNLVDLNSIDIITSGQPNEPFGNTLTDSNLFPPIDRNTKNSIRGQNKPVDQSLGNVLGDQGILQPLDSQRGPIDNTQRDPLIIDGNMLSSSKVDLSIKKPLLDIIDIQSGRPVNDQFITSSNKQIDTSNGIAQIGSQNIQLLDAQIGSQNIQLLDNTRQGTTVSDLPQAVPVQTMNSTPDLPLSANTLQSTDTSSSFSKNSNINFQNNVLDIQNVPAVNSLNDNPLTGSGIRTLSDRSQNLGTPSGSLNLFPKTSQLDLQLNSGIQPPIPQSGNILDVQGRVGSKMLDVSQTQSSKSTLQDKGQFIATQGIDLQNTNVTGISPKNIEVGVILSNGNASLLPQDKQLQSNTHLGQFIHQSQNTLSQTGPPGMDNNTLTDGAFTNAFKTLNINDTYGTSITLNNTLIMNDTYGTQITLNDTLQSSSGKITNTIDSNMLKADTPTGNSATSDSINTKHQVQDPLLMNPEQQQQQQQQQHQNRGMLPNPFVHANQLHLNGRQQTFNPQTGVPIMASQSAVGLPPTITIGGRSPGFGLFRTNANVNPHDVNTMFGQFSAPIRNIGAQFMQAPVQFAPFMPPGVSINDIRSRIQRQNILQQISNLPRQIQPQNSNSLKVKTGSTKDNSTSKQVKSVSPPRQQANLTPSTLGTSQDGTVQGVHNNQADLSNGISNGRGMPVQGLTMNSGGSQQMGSAHFTGMRARIPGFMLPRQTAQSNVHLVDQFRSVSNPVGLAFQPDSNPGISQTGAPFLNTMSGPIPLGFQTSNGIARGSNNLNGISTNGLNRQTVPGIQRGTKATMDYSTLKTVISEVLNDFFKHQISSVKSPKLSHDTVVNTVAQAVMEAKAKSPNLNITHVGNTTVSTIPSQDTLLTEPKKDAMHSSSPQGVLLNISSSGTNFTDVGTQAIHLDASRNYSNSIFVGNVTLNTAFIDNATNKNAMGNNAENIVLKTVAAVTESIVPPNNVHSDLLLDKVTSGPAAITASFIEAKTTKASLKLSTTLSPIDPMATTMQLPANEVAMKKMPAEKVNPYQPEFKFTTMSTTLLPHKKSGGFANVINIKTDVPAVKPKYAAITTRLPDIIVSEPRNSALNNVAAVVPSSNTGVNKGTIPTESMTFKSEIAVDKFPNDLGRGGYNFEVPLNSNGQTPHTLTIETSLFDAGQRKTRIDSMTRDRPSNMQDNRNSQVSKNLMNSFASSSGSSLNIEAELQQGTTKRNSKVSNRNGNSFASLSGTSLNFEGNLQQGSTEGNSQFSNKRGNSFASSGSSLDFEGNLQQGRTDGNSQFSDRRGNLFASSGSSLNFEGNLLQSQSNGNSKVSNRRGNSFASLSGSSLDFEGNLKQGRTDGNSQFSNKRGNSFASSGSSLNFEGDLLQGQSNGNSKVSNRHGNSFASLLGSSLDFEGNLKQGRTDGNSQFSNKQRNAFVSSGSSLNFEGNLLQGQSNGNSKVPNRHGNSFASLSGSSLNFEGNLHQGHSKNSQVSDKQGSLFASSGSSLNFEGNLLQGHSNGNTKKHENLFASSLGSSLNIEGNLHQSHTNGNSKNSFALAPGSALNIEGNLNQNDISTQSGDRSFLSKTSPISNGQFTPNGIRNGFEENLRSRGFGTSNVEITRQLSGGISAQESKRHRGTLPEILNSKANMGARIGRQTSSRTATDINNIGGLSSNSKRLSQRTATSLDSPLSRKRLSTNTGVIYSPSVNTFKFSSRFLNNQPAIKNEPKPIIVDPIVPSTTLQTVTEAVTVRSFVTPPSLVNGIISDSTSFNIESVNLGTVRNIASKTIPDVVLPVEPGKVTDFVASSIVGDSSPPPVPKTLTKLNKSSSVSFNDSLMVGSGAMSHDAYFEYSLQPMHRMTNDKKAFIINNELANNIIVTDSPREVSKNAKAAQIVSSSSTHITKPVLSNFNNRFNI